MWKHTLNWAKVRPKARVCNVNSYDSICLGRVTLNRFDIFWFFYNVRATESLPFHFLRGTISPDVISIRASLWLFEVSGAKTEQIDALRKNDRNRIWVSFLFINFLLLCSYLFSAFYSLVVVYFHFYRPNHFVEIGLLLGAFYLVRFDFLFFIAVVAVSRQSKYKLLCIQTLSSLANSTLPFISCFELFFFVSNNILLIFSFELFFPTFSSTTAMMIIMMMMRTVWNIFVLIFYLFLGQTRSCSTHTRIHARIAELHMLCEVTNGKYANH